VIDIQALLGESSNPIISRLTVAERCGQIYVKGVGIALYVVPEPATMALLGLGWLMILPIRRK